MSTLYRYWPLVSGKYYRHLKIWVRGGFKVTEMVPFESFGTVYYLHYITTSLEN